MSKSLVVVFIVYYSSTALATKMNAKLSTVEDGSIAWRGAVDWGENYLLLHCVVAATSSIMW